MSVRTRTLLLVAAGGALGTLLRLAATAGESDGVPWSTLLVNLAGAFGLGVLVAVLAARDDRAALRLVVGAGLFGALTTWSGLAVQTVLLVRDGRAATGALYLLLNLAGGVLAAVAGLRLGRPRAAA